MGKKGADIYGAVAHRQWERALTLLQISDQEDTNYSGGWVRTESEKLYHAPMLIHIHCTYVPVFISNTHRPWYTFTRSIQTCITQFKSCQTQILITCNLNIHLLALAMQDKETALMLASYHGREDCVQLLLERGADVNKQSNVREQMMFNVWTNMKN